jgi:hypothetical protein
MVYSTHMAHTLAYHLLFGFIIPPRSNSLVGEWEPIDVEFLDSCRFGLVGCRLGLGLGSDFSEYICRAVGLPFAYGVRRSPAYFL